MSCHEGYMGLCPERYIAVIDGNTVMPPEA